MAFTIPLNSEFKDYQFTQTIENTTYLFNVRFNQRMAKWTMSLSLADGTEIIGMRPIISNWLPFSRFRDTRLPKGEFIFLDTTGQAVDPTDVDLGTRVILVFLEEGDLA